MKATTLTGLPADARRLLVAIRDRSAYQLPRGMEPNTPPAMAHLTRLTRILGTAGLIAATETDPTDPTKVFAVALTDKGQKAAKGL